MAASRRPARSDPKPPPPLRIGLVQARATPDADENLRRTRSRIEEAAAKGAKVVCTQELFRTPYFPQREDASQFALAEPVPGPTTQALSDTAKKHGIVVVGSVFERRAPGLYHNTAVVLDADGRLAGTYRKMHVPDDPRFYEKYYFAPGDLGFRAFDTKHGRIGVLVCWDQWYPEAARLTALQGASVLFYPTAIGTWTGEAALAAEHREAWTTIQRSHAVANGVFVAAVNRVGREGELDFWGGSFVAKPFGALCAQASTKAEEVLLADCDLSEIERVRRAWPFLRDRRIDAYAPLQSRYLDGAAAPDAATQP